MKNNTHNFFYMELLSVFSNIITKGLLVLQNIWGLTLSLLSSLLLYTAPIQTFIGVISVLVISDMVLGIYLNRKHILSSKLRNTLVKLVFYVFTLVLSFCIENSINVLLLTPMLFSVMAIVELISIIANMALILPNAKFFNLVKIILKSEISKKTNIDSKVIDEIIDKKEDTK